jgi:hypothetical protein
MNVITVVLNGIKYNIGFGIKNKIHCLPHFRRLKSYNTSLVIILSLLLFYPRLHAQNNEAFESFNIGSNYIYNVNSKTLNDFYSTGSGFELYFSSPFYFGNVRTGFSYLPFSGRSEIYPDYNSFFISIQWGYGIELPLNIIFSLNAITGINLLEFDKSELLLISPGEFSEIEFFSGLNSELSYRVFGGWHINISTSYLAIFTNKEINLLNISFGISRSFTSPKWLKEFLE